MSESYPSPADGPAPSPSPAMAKPPLAQLLVGIVALVLAASGVILITLVEMPTEKAVMVAGFVGAAVQWAGNVVAYYFGSSAGSAARAETVDRLVGSFRR